jgi:protein-tyrosine phosphatase
VKICFVCLGNICRSPTAEGVMRKLVDDAGLTSRISVDSAGTGDWHVGELPDARSRAAAAKRGYQLEHRARHFKFTDFDIFDLVVPMDHDNLSYLTRLARGRFHAPMIRLLREFDTKARDDAEVPDPYSGGPEGFEEVLDICERACRGLLAYVRERA